jgi:branched-chain amino acid transport system permease protein
MDMFIQQLLNGLVLGSLYALIALGYTMVYGILRIINFAHGDVLMIGALIGLSAIHLLQSAFPGLPDIVVLIVAGVIAMAACALLAGLIERIAYRRLRNAPRLAPLISGLGVSLLLQTVAMLIWSRNPQVFPQLLPLDAIEVTAGDATHAPAITNMTAIITVLVAMLVMGGLLLLVGIMMASNYGSAHFYMGFLPGLKAFTAAVLGGIGNLKGAMLGGILLGLIEALGTGYMCELTDGVFGSSYQDVFAFMVLIAVLVLRPSGLLGERLAVRA